MIDGIDLEGLEYATFTIRINLKSGLVTSIGTATDYELKNKYTKGPGIQYDYVDERERQLATTFTKNYHGIYLGPNNPMLPEVGKKTTDPKVYDYSLAPIDEADAVAKKHDLHFDAKEIEGIDGVMSNRGSEANRAYINGANKILEKYKAGEKDDVTGKPFKSATLSAAKASRDGFRLAEMVKKVYNKFKKEGSDPIKIIK